jgi:hypothetical protein
MTDENKDLQARVKGFNEELIPLLGKYKLGLGATPLILPDGRLAAKPNLFDDSKEESKVEPAPANAESGTKESGIAAA